MNKINYLRKVWTEKYEAKDLAAAAKIGEVLLDEHWHNENIHAKGYANDLFNLACVYDELGDLERAAELYSDSANRLVGENLSGSERLQYSMRINSLATTLIRLGVKEPALFMLGSVAAGLHSEDKNNPLYADALYNLGNASAETGFKKEAIRYHLDALKIRENEGHIEDIIHSLHSLAFIYEAMDDYGEAISYAETAMSYAVTDDHGYARAVNYLASLYEGALKYEKAFPLYDRVLEIAEKEVGREHSAYLNVALRRANLLALLDRHEEALSAHEEIRVVFARVSGKKHIFYANCLRGMAMLHKTLNHPDEAEALILEAMKIRRNIFEDITLDITFLIRLHLQESNPTKALEALIYALMCSGSDSPSFPELLNILVEVFSKTEMPDTMGFLDSMEVLNDKEKLRPIIAKWTEWEEKE
ncbi:MAG: tetratricopeptide repeat protein [Defluviitaleaceae bacterium]|nr:tetratricopeptide repeat protein [Defluviitaleaceae bacterium]